MIAPEAKVDYSKLLDYKKSVGDRMAVIAFQYNWDQPTSNITQLPDSLDVVVIKSGYDKIDNRLDEQLQLVHARGTKVLLSLDLREPALAANKEIKKEIKAKSNALKKEWAKLAEQPSADEKTVTLTELSEKVKAQKLEQLHAATNAKADYLLEQLSQHSLDGLSIELSEQTDIYSVEVQKSLLEKFSAKLGEGKLFIVENPLSAEELRAVIGKATYLVGRDNGDLKIARQEALAVLWPEVKYCISFDLSQEENKKKFKDSGVFTLDGETTIEREAYLWQAANKGGVAVYHSEADYSTSSSQEGYIKPYAWFRSYINQVFANNQ